MDRVGAYPNMSKKCFDVSYAQAKTYKEKTSIALERIYTAEAEIQRLTGLTKAQDDTIQEQAKLIESYKAEIKAKDERIAELEAMVQKMKCCENCDFYPPQKCSFDTQYGCLDGQIPSNWKIKQRKNDE